jgi:prepilin-type N-terminal cleavage/methylation domain-containing protein
VEVTARPFRSPRAPGLAAGSGFTLIEILVVMSIFAILMGLGVGYLQNIGRTSRVVQARAILRETAYACKQSSNGGTRAILDLREKPRGSGTVLVTGAAIAAPVLTHNFETLDFVGGDFPSKVNGRVECVEDGYVGRAARFQSGGTIDFERQAAFAVTEGLSLDVWVAPEAGAPRNMTIASAEGSWQVQLVPSKVGDAFDVALDVWLKPDDSEDRGAALKTTFRSEAGPVRPGGGWAHVQVRYDGVAVSLKVDDLEYAPKAVRPRVLAGDTPDAASASSPDRKRIAVPEGGTVPLTLSSANAPFTGRMDSLVFGGVFRSAELERELLGVKLVSPKLPVRVVFANGRLDPSEHAADVVLVLAEEANLGGPRVELRLGLHGAIEDRLVGGGGSTTP